MHTTSYWVEWNNPDSTRQSVGFIARESALALRDIIASTNLVATIRRYEGYHLEALLAECQDYIPESTMAVPQGWSEID